jgi:hypothetical protein
VRCWSEKALDAIKEKPRKNKGETIELQVNLLCPDSI